MTDNFQKGVRSMLAIGILWASPGVHAGVYDDMLNAVNLKDYDKVAELLRRGMDVNTTDPAGNSLLMLAIRNGDTHIVELLLRNRANTRIINKYNDSALMLAALQGSLQNVKALVQAGAEIDPEGWTPLIYAAYAGHKEVVDYLLTLDIDIDAQSGTGTTALMGASKNGHVEIARDLIAHDADLALTDQDGRTALDLAMTAGNSEIAALLEGEGKQR